MTIDERKIIYSVDSGKFFERMKKTTNWTEAKQLMRALIAKSKKKTALLIHKLQSSPVMTTNKISPASMKIKKWLGPSSDKSL